MYVFIQPYFNGDNNPTLLHHFYPLKSSFKTDECLRSDLLGYNKVSILNTRWAKNKPSIANLKKNTHSSCICSPFSLVAFPWWFAQTPEAMLYPQANMLESL